MSPAGRISKEDVLDGKMYAVLAYLSILCIVPLIVKKNNTFVLSHGRQGLVLFVAEVASLVVSIVIPWVFRPLLFILFGFSFWGMVMAIRGQAVELPFIARIAEKITI
jgi:fumarate reductase subunit D